MNVTSLPVPSLSPYAAPLIDRRTEGTASTLNSVLAPAPLDLSGLDGHATLAVNPAQAQPQTARQRLDQQQAALGQQLLSGMAQQGRPLSQEVSFSLGADDTLSVKGSTGDVDKVLSFLQRDTSQPSLHDRLSDMLQSTQALSTSAQPSSATPMAARHAGSSSNVLSLYGQIAPRQNEASATLTLSPEGSSLSYAGMFSSRA